MLKHGIHKPLPTPLKVAETQIQIICNHKLFEQPLAANNFMKSLVNKTFLYKFG